MFRVGLEVGDVSREGDVVRLRERESEVGKGGELPVGRAEPRGVSRVRVRT